MAQRRHDAGEHERRRRPARTEPVEPVEHDDGDQAAAARPNAVRPRADDRACRPRSRRTSAPRRCASCRRLRGEGLRIGGVVSLAVASVVLFVLGPRVLGSATNTIVDGRAEPERHRLHEAPPHAAARARPLRRRPRCSRYVQAYVLAGIVQRTMSRLRTEVEEKLNRLPLRDVDRMPRGDLLSRVTNDIDNLAQSLQQTLEPDAHVGADGRRRDRS